MNRLRQHPKLAFAAAAALMAAGYAAFIPWHAAAGLGPWPDWTLALDLLVVLPLLWLWLQPAPRGRQAWLGALGVALAGIWVGSWLLADEDKQLWRWLEPLRWVAIAALVALQLVVTGAALKELSGALRRRGAAAAPTGLLEDDLHRVLARSLGAGPLLSWLQLDARLWLYALLPTRHLSGTPAAGERWFPVHRQGGNLSSQWGFVVLIGVEIPIVHVLLHLWAGAGVAAVVTALSVYGWLFFWAEARATRWRPVALDNARLCVRHGLVVDAVVPRQAIVSARVHRGAEPARAAGRLRVTGMGRANVRIELAPGTRLALLTGERDVGEIFIGVDEPERLVQALSEPP